MIATVPQDTATDYRFRPCQLEGAGVPRQRLAMWSPDWMKAAQADQSRLQETGLSGAR